MFQGYVYCSVCGYYANNYKVLQLKEPCSYSATVHGQRALNAFRRNRLPRAVVNRVTNSFLGSSTGPLVVRGGLGTRSACEPPMLAELDQLAPSIVQPPLLDHQRHSLLPQPEPMLEPLCVPCPPPPSHGFDDPERSACGTPGDDSSSE